MGVDKAVAVGVDKAAAVGVREAVEMRHASAHATADWRQRDNNGALGHWVIQVMQFKIAQKHNCAAL